MDKAPNRLGGVYPPMWRAHQRRSESEDCTNDTKSRASEPGLPIMDSAVSPVKDCASVPVVGGVGACPPSRASCDQRVPTGGTGDPPVIPPNTSRKAAGCHQRSSPAPIPNPLPLIPSPSHKGGSTHHSFSEGGPGGGLVDGSAYPEGGARRPRPTISIPGPRSLATGYSPRRKRRTLYTLGCGHRAAPRCPT